MPLFEFECDCCDAVTTSLIRNDEDREASVCKECGATSEHLTKVISPTSFMLYGKGVYNPSIKEDLDELFGGGKK